MKHRLLVAVDGQKTSWKTAIYVGRACAGMEEPGFGIVLFHVLPPVPHQGPVGVATARIRELAKPYRAETRHEAETILIEMKERVVREGVKADFISTSIGSSLDDYANQILRAATFYDCDTIVVGRRGKSMIGKFLAGSVVERLLRNPTGFTIWVVE